jgi:lysine 2,3-aminomutase
MEVILMKVNRRSEIFSDATDEQWNSWKWQVKNRIETVEELKKYIPLTKQEEEGIRQCLQTLRMAITPYYLSLIDTNCPRNS